MYEIYPDYYHDFKCIAGDCQHTCCANWEIDIDEESLERYKQDGIGFISEEETPHFILKDDRCPYLNDDNLCELYIQYGEDYLCQICTDHPRFRNYWTDTVETGLGMSCEAAARLILSRETPMELCILDSDIGEVVDYEDFVQQLPEDEQYLFDLRDQMLFQASQMPDPMAARLAEYLIFRQLPDALYDGMLDERIRFIEDSVERIVQAWSELPEGDFEGRCEVARAFSDEIEYDPEKLAMILEGITYAKKNRD